MATMAVAHGTVALQALMLAESTRQPSFRLMPLAPVRLRNERPTELG